MREQILKASARLFMLHGFNGTSMQDLASAVKLTKGALYHHFPAKPDMLYAIEMQVADAIDARIALHPDGASPSEKISLLLRDMLELIDEMPDEVRVYFQESPLLDSCLPRAQVRVLREREGRITDYVETALEEGILAGEIRPVDVRMASFAILGMVMWAPHWYRAGRRATVNEIGDLFTSIVLDGLAEGGSPLTIQLSEESRR